MRALRLFMICCLLVALPLAGLAAPLDCCPPNHAVGHLAVAPDVDDAHHAHVGHMTQDAQTAVDTDCADPLCDLHCAHAPSLTGTALPLPPSMKAQSLFPAPLPRAALATAPPNFRPPITARC
jgi:hypothetical protein